MAIKYIIEIEPEGTLPYRKFTIRASTPESAERFELSSVDRSEHRIYVESYSPVRINGLPNNKTSAAPNELPVFTSSIPLNEVELIM